MANVDDLFDCFEDNDDDNQQIVPIVTKDGPQSKVIEEKW